MCKFVILKCFAHLTRLGLIIKPLVKAFFGYSKMSTNSNTIVLHDSMLEIMRDYNKSIEKVCPDRAYFFPSIKHSYYRRDWLIKNFKLLWYKVNTSHATAYELRHHYAMTNINRWVDLGFDFDDKLVFLSKSMGHTTLESTKYYYGK